MKANVLFLMKVALVTVRFIIIFVSLFQQVGESACSQMHNADIWLRLFRSLVMSLFNVYFMVIFYLI